MLHKEQESQQQNRQVTVPLCIHQYNLYRLSLGMPLPLVLALAVARE